MIQAILFVALSDLVVPCGAQNCVLVGNPDGGTVKLSGAVTTKKGTIYLPDAGSILTGDVVPEQAATPLRVLGNQERASALPDVIIGGSMARDGGSDVIRFVSGNTTIGSLSGAGVLTVAAVASSGTAPLGKVDVLDAGVANIQGQLGVAGPAIVNSLETKVASGGITLSGANSRVTFDTGQFLISNGATGRLFSTGGYSAPSFSLGSAVGATSLADSATAPTISNGCTGEAVTWSNGSANFRFDVGATCTGVTSTVITLPAGANCWTCTCFDIAADATLQQAFAGCATTTFTISNRTRATQAATDYVDSADIQCMCRGG